MDTFDNVARKYLTLHGVLLRAVEEDNQPVIMALIQRIQTICDETITLLSDKKDELVREQRELLEETQTKLNTELEKTATTQQKLLGDRQDLEAREKSLREGQAKLNQDLDQIKNDRAKIIEDQAKIAQVQARVIEDQAKVIKDRAEITTQQATLRQKKREFHEAQEKAKEDREKFELQVQQQANEKCEGFRTEIAKEYENKIVLEKQSLDANYQNHYTTRIEREEKDLSAKYETRSGELEDEYAQRNTELKDGYTRRMTELDDEHARRRTELEEELNTEKKNTIATRDTLNKSIEAIKLLNDILKILSPQQLGQSEIAETLLSRQNQEGDLLSAPHHTHDTAAEYFSQLDSATHSLEEERDRHEVTRANLASTTSTLTELRDRIPSLENDKATLKDDKATLEARLRTSEEQLEQLAKVLEEQKKEHENDKASLGALRSAQLQSAKRKRARDEAADTGPTFWHQTMKDASEALDLFFVARACSMKANELVPQLWGILDDGSLYKRLLGFHNNAQPSNWRCLRTIVTKGLFVAKPLPETGCPHHPAAEEKCLQVRVVVEEEGGRAMDFRMA